MTAIFPFLLFLIFAACVGFLYPEGMWSNAIRLINVVTAGLLATNYWEPVARLADNSVSESFTFFWDFISLWGLFAVFLVIFRVATNSLSRVKVRFLKIADRIGGVAFAVAVGWVMVCFITFSLHTATLCRNFLFEGFKPGEANFVGLAPDKMWLGFAGYCAAGVFSTSPAVVFDGQKFINNYAARRDQIEVLPHVEERIQDRVRRLWQHRE